MRSDDIGSDGARVATISAEIMHIGVLAALHSMSFDTPWSANTFADLVTAQGAVARLALLDEEPIGLVIGRIAGDEAEILTICVTPKGRRHGAARRLMKDALAAFD